MSGCNMHLLSTLATIKVTRHQLMNRSMIVGGKVDATNLPVVWSFINNSRTERIANVAQVGSVKLWLQSYPAIKLRKRLLPSYFTLSFH